MNILANRIRFLEDNDTGTFLILTTWTHDVMCRQFDTIRPFLTSSVLSSICKCAILSTPSDLVWTPVDTDDTGCYDSVVTLTDGKINLYSINIITGMVLFNGRALEKLDASITSNPLYIKTFGYRNFEIIKSSNGVSNTLHSLGMYSYSFYLDNRNNHLTIVETS